MSEKHLSERGTTGETPRRDAVNAFVNQTRMRQGECTGYESALLGMLNLYADHLDILERGAPDPGTEKLLRGMLDRAYKMMQMAGYRVNPQDSNHNDPIIAWMSDARHVLYGSGRQPDPVADLQGRSRA